MSCSPGLQILSLKAVLTFYEFSADVVAKSPRDQCGHPDYMQRQKLPNYLLELLETQAIKIETPLALEEWLEAQGISIIKGFSLKGCWLGVYSIKAQTISAASAMMRGNSMPLIMPCAGSMQSE